MRKINIENKINEICDAKNKIELLENELNEKIKILTDEYSSLTISLFKTIDKNIKIIEKHIKNNKKIFGKSRTLKFANGQIQLRKLPDFVELTLTQNDVIENIKKHDNLQHLIKTEPYLDKQQILSEIKNSKLDIDELSSVGLKIIKNKEIIDVMV